MRWSGRAQSRNVEDRRRAAPMRVVAGGGSVVGLLVLMGVVWLLGGNPLSVLTSVGPAQQQPSGAVSAADDQRAAFVATVLRDTEVVWGEIFAAQGRQYRPPVLVLFRDQTQSGCGFAGSAVGPFYCPADEKIYIDLSFYDQLASQLGAPGDFAQAYVLAHEVGHHVQRLLGTTDQVNSRRGRISESAQNDLSVRLELQADFLAGVWAHHAQQRWNILEPGDIEEAIGAASAVGDDTLQRRSQGHVVPDSFTHGTSAQRVKWFRRGFESGDLTNGDTFTTPDL